MGEQRERRVQQAHRQAAERSRSLKACGNKRYFADEVLAYATLLDIKTQFPQRHTLHMYRCTFCHGFYHGNGQRTLWEDRMEKGIQPGLEIQRKKIAPAMAKMLLRNNTMNRPLSPTLVQYYAADMRADKWLVTGDTIKVASDGTVLDGQHRLAAIIEAGKPVDMLVAYHVSKEVMPVIDVGKSRTVSQQLAIRGVENATKVAAVAKAAYIGVHGGLQNLNTPEHFPTKQQLHAFLVDHPEIHLIVKDLHMCKLLPTSISGALYLLFMQKSHPDTEHFFAALMRGENLTRDDPILVLRQRLIEYKASRIKAQVTHKEIAAWVIKAWNAYRQQKIIRPYALRWTRRGQTKEVFPEIL